MPIPRPRPPAAYSLPHPQPQIPRPPRDLFPEVYPSNDPNVYDASGIERFGAGPATDAAESIYDDDDDGGSGIDAYAGGASDYDYDGDNGGGLNLGSIGVAGGVVVSIVSLLMWLRKRR